MAKEAGRWVEVQGHEREEDQGEEGEEEEKENDDPQDVD